ncbi:MAG: thioredoxin domain-containing protein [Candidatus Paceibacterota bacterium]|jgi:protein-disulfide isomerase
MNIKRLVFWAVFVLILGLIIWGLAIAMNKPVPGTTLSSPAPISTFDHVRGTEDAPVTLIEYSDFQCLACQTYYYIISKLLDENSSKIRFVYRHFPLDNILPDGKVQHPNAIPSAMASEAAGAQGKFWEMYDLIFDNAIEWKDVTDPTDIFVGYATKLKLNTEQFKADLSSTTLRAKIKRDKDDGVKIGINSTPTFFINGKAITNPPNYEEFKAIIDTASVGN